MTTKTRLCSATAVRNARREPRPQAPVVGSSGKDNEMRAVRDHADGTPVEGCCRRWRVPGFADRIQACLFHFPDTGKTRQTYDVGIGIDGRIGQFVLRADYRGAFRLALGTESEVTERFNHTFGVDVTWDPND